MRRNLGTIEICITLYCMLIDVEDNIPKEWWKKPKSNADDDSEINSSFAASDLAVVIGECNFSFPFALDNAHDARHK